MQEELNDRAAREELGLDGRDDDDDDESFDIETGNDRGSAEGPDRADEEGEVEADEAECFGFV